MLRLRHWYYGRRRRQWFVVNFVRQPLVLGKPEYYLMHRRDVLLTKFLRNPVKSWRFLHGEVK